jgi:hypothetical protein
MILITYEEHDVQAAAIAYFLPIIESASFRANSYGAHPVLQRWGVIAKTPYHPSPFSSLKNRE